MDEYIDVKIDVFENTGQRARVRRTLTPRELIREILKEFDDIPADAPEKYAIYLKGDDRPLKADDTLIQLDIQPQDELVFDYIRQTLRRPLRPEQFAYLREEKTGRLFEISWQPAVLGRPTNEADHNLTLAVNVQSIPDGMTISRRHAQFIVSEERYYLEVLAENNPVLLNGKEVPVNARRELKSGDKLAFGRNKVTFTFFTHPPAGADLRQPVSAASPRPSTPVAPSAPPVPVPAPVSAHPALVVEQASQPTNLGQRLELFTFPYLLGRDLPQLRGEADVSRRHAEIHFDPATAQFTITDLGSTNGTFLESGAIPPNIPCALPRGSRVRLGPRVVLRLEG
ncbi:MAG: FHA domain-containing protein [Anaerolineales bacterium]|nr:FHA domain-containing protein [Anaerolineales bacterium]MDW8276930.1 FHA domain-containing protein [Anaerolineales bacterium]